MKYFLSLILLAIITTSCAQEFKVLSAEKTASYTGTSGFSGWNIKIKIKENRNDIVYHYLLKDEQECKFVLGNSENGLKILLAYEDQSPMKATYPPVEKKGTVPTNKGQIIYSVGKSGKIKSIKIENFKIEESKNNILRQ